MIPPLPARGRAAIGTFITFIRDAQFGTPRRRKETTMNRILTLTTGGLFAAMAVLPAAAFAETSATPGKDAKPQATMTAQPTDGKTVAPTTGTSAGMTGHKVETKTEAKGGTVKHDGTVKTPEAHSSVQPNPAEQPNKS